MPKSKLNLLIAVIRGLVVVAILIGIGMTLVRHLEVRSTIQGQHQRLVRKTKKLSSSETEETLVMLLSKSGMDEMMIKDIPVRMSWTWRVQPAQSQNYNVFWCVGQVSSEGLSFIDFSRGDRPVTAYSRRLNCKSLADFNVGELGPLITYSVEYDKVGRRWYGRPAIAETLNHHLEPFGFLTDPDQWVVDHQPVEAIQSYARDEMIQLCRIRSKEISQTKVVDGKTVQLHHGMFIYLVPERKSLKFREAVGF